MTAGMVIAAIAAGCALAGIFVLGIVVGAKLADEQCGADRGGVIHGDGDTRSPARAAPGNAAADSPFAERNGTDG